MPDERSPPQFVLVVHVTEKTRSDELGHSDFIMNNKHEATTPREESAPESKHEGTFMTARDFLSSRDFITSCVSLISRDKGNINDKYYININTKSVLLGDITTGKAEPVTPNGSVEPTLVSDKDDDKGRIMELDKDVELAKRDPNQSREIRKRRGDRKRIDSAYEVTGAIGDIASSDEVTVKKPSKHEETRGDICTGWVVLRSLTQFQVQNIISYL